MKKLLTQYAQPFRTGSSLYRIIINHNESDKLLRTYEVWPTLDALKSYLEDFNSDTPTQEQLNRYGVMFYEQRIKDTNGNIPEEETGALITKDAITYARSETFSEELLLQQDPLIQTNISLPTSLHKWIKYESAKDRESLSETIRKALVYYRNRRFICATCGIEKMGSPELKGDCIDCFNRHWSEASI